MPPGRSHVAERSVAGRKRGRRLLRIVDEFRLPLRVSEASAEAAERRERDVLGLLREAGELLGRCVVGVVNVLAVAAVKVVGEGHVLWPFLGPYFTAAAAAGVIEPLSDLEITVSPWREVEHARGAACLVPARSGAITGSRS
ncbi:hypothetical protein ACF08N_05845 [Streptomyces sp. NPDC015127]|uniref:hypothetical protein n=1 Tax=Streptomyces sp. NPDC015127 TaxID=3364939 RepID=UPI003700A206